MCGFTYIYIYIYVKLYRQEQELLDLGLTFHYFFHEGTTLALVNGTNVCIGHKSLCFQTYRFYFLDVVTDTHGYACTLDSLFLIPSLFFLADLRVVLYMYEEMHLRVLKLVEQPMFSLGDVYVRCALIYLFYVTCLNRKSWNCHIEIFRLFVLWPLSK